MGGGDYMAIFSSASFKRSDQKHDIEGLTDREIDDRLKYADKGMSPRMIALLVDGGSRHG